MEKGVWKRGFGAGLPVYTPRAILKWGMGRRAGKICERRMSEGLLPCSLLQFARFTSQICTTRFADLHTTSCRRFAQRASSRRFAQRACRFAQLVTRCISQICTFWVRTLHLADLHCISQLGTFSHSGTPRRFARIGSPSHTHTRSPHFRSSPGLQASACFSQ